MDPSQNTDHKCDSVHKHDIIWNFQIYNPFLHTVQYLYILCLHSLGLLAVCFPFEGGKIASVNSVSIANILNDDMEIIYGT